MIVTVASILSISEQNRDQMYWNDVAERRNSVFTDAYDEISKVLFPSYDYLPQNLKTSKTCRLHSSWQHVCRREASKNKFYHVLNKQNDASRESLKVSAACVSKTTFYLASKSFAT